MSCFPNRSDWDLFRHGVGANPFEHVVLKRLAARWQRPSLRSDRLNLRAERDFGVEDLVSRLPVTGGLVRVGKVGRAIGLQQRIQAIPLLLSLSHRLKFPTSTDVPPSRSKNPAADPCPAVVSWFAGLT